MRARQLGGSGPVVSRLGLGCMGMSPGVYGEADTEESIATIHAAVEGPAAELELPDAVFEQLEAALPPGAAAGERYAAPQMATLDSER